MNVLLVTDSYPPEIRSASQIMGELSGELRSRGHNVTVLTTMPRYNIAGNELSNKFPIVINEDGIEVIRLNTLPLHKAGAIVRGIANLVLPYTFLRNGKKHIKSKIDMIIVYSPPLTLGTAGVWLKSYFKAKLIVNIQDIFPQQAIDLGLMKQKMLIAFFEWIENNIYKSADFLTVHSDGNKEFLVNRKQVNPGKMEIVHNWVDTGPFENTPSTGRFRKKYGVEGKFVLIYAGIIGLPQGLDKVLDVAVKLRNEKDIIFLLVGDGLNKDMLVNRCRKENIDNVIFQDFVSLQDYPELVKECDMGLVSLSSDNKTPVIPGKLMGYMAAEIPAVAILNKESGGHQIVKEAQCGISVTPENADDLAVFIKSARDDSQKRKLMGRNGKNYLLKHFTLKNSIDKYENIFTKIGGFAHE